MATNDARERAIRTLIIGAAVAAGGAIAFGYVSVQVSPWLAGMGVAAFAAISYAVASSDDEVSVSFGLTLVAVLLLVLEFVVPEGIVAMLPIAPFLDAVDPAQFALIVGFVVLFYWILDIRFISSGGRTPNPDTVARRVSRRAERLVEQYFSIGKIAFTFGIVVGVLFLNTFVAPIIGEFGSIAADAPYVASNVAAIGLGYLTLGGDVPILNGIPFIAEIGAQGFLLLAGLALVLAVGVDYGS